MNSNRRYLLIFFPLVVLLIIEIVLRFAGYPAGLFAFALKGKAGLFAPNASIPQRWGPIPFTIVTNQFGFRGAEFAFKKSPEVLRIAAVGDSVTLGFFVENHETYPAILQRKLEGYRKVEVLNAAFGGGSIDKELVILKEIVLPLKPDVVLLTFVTNDIWDIRNKTLHELLNLQMKEPTSARLTKWFLTETATGEAAFDLYMKTQSSRYRAAESKERPTAPVRNVQKSTGSNFVANARKFNEVFQHVDGRILNARFDTKTAKIVENYRSALSEFIRLCKSNHVRFVLVYFPAYSQIYLPDTSMTMRDILKKHCTERGVSFLDLTNSMREQGKDRALHFAPADFHLNAAGNEVMASAIADFLKKHVF